MICNIPGEISRKQAELDLPKTFVEIFPQKCVTCDILNFEKSEWFISLAQAKAYTLVFVLD